ncbi:hypothetical protein DOTSEDRAFT_73061 [Dothistroma septosporum NZE10]|uniref:Uncharacterized protein n=1 Tax=Dothistroma septosporum (strain NZE10 / CBS 128990) TaxID=675120 RepID=N1PJ59_DOTSN|nr:hypothetical protein DOTSEDRAFT_73061 [Dothistroma septosporum NZE10]
MARKAAPLPDDLRCIVDTERTCDIAKRALRWSSLQLVHLDNSGKPRGPHLSPPTAQLCCRWARSAFLF